MLASVLSICAGASIGALLCRMKKAAVLALVIPFWAFPCLADEGAKPSKSAEECAAEAGGLTGRARERKMMDCLLSHTSAPPAAAHYFVRSFSHTVNSVGGVEPEGVFENPSDASAIKYISLQVRMFNAVGDVIRSRIGGASTASLRVTGPLSAEDEPKSSGWEPVWYNSTASCIKIESVRVQFMNGKVQSFEGANLRKALHPEIVNDCRVQPR